LIHNHGLVLSAAGGGRGRHVSRGMNSRKSFHRSTTHDPLHGQFAAIAVVFSAAHAMIVQRSINARAK
jgi:hypothetical protein